MNPWQVCDPEQHLMVHLFSGVYFGRSARIGAGHEFDGRLFTTTLQTAPTYHCIAWCEL